MLRRLRPLLRPGLSTEVVVLVHNDGLITRLEGPARWRREISRRLELRLRLRDMLLLSIEWCWRLTWRTRSWGLWR